MSDTDFREYLAALPETTQAEAANDESESRLATAYWHARRAGWEKSTLAHDAKTRADRGAGIGAIIGSLRAFARRPPAGSGDKAEAAGTTVWTTSTPGTGIAIEPHDYNDDGGYCAACQLPGGNRVHTLTVGI